MDRNPRIVDETPLAADRAMGIAAIMQAVPRMVWAFAIAFLSLLILASIWFHYQDLQGFTNEMLTWAWRGLVILVVLIAIRISWKMYQAGHNTYHATMVAREDRRTARAIADKVELQVETLRLKNRQLAAKLELDPMIIQYALAQGHNIDYTKDGALKVTNYLSNMQTMFPANPPSPAQLEGPDKAVKTFAELLSDGTITDAVARGEIVHGYVNGILRLGTWNDIWTGGFAGVAGGGKSTTVRMYMFQALLFKARLMMIDPHINDPKQSLAHEFMGFTTAHIMPPCGRRVSDIEKRIKWQSNELKRRIDHGITEPLIFFVIDELNAVMRIEEVQQDLVKLLLELAQEGRKFGMFAFLIGQRWSDNDLGGSGQGAQVRSSLTSKQAHRFTDEDQAKRFFNSKHGPKCLELEQGFRYFMDTNGRVDHIQTPYTASSDGELVQRLLQGNISEITEETGLSADETSHAEPLQLSRFREERTTETTPETTAGDDRIADLARRVMLLQADNIGKPDIMRQLWGVNPGGSEAYQRALEEYKAVMRYIAERLGA